MTPEEFKIELQKLQLDSVDEKQAVGFDPTGVYSIHVENAEWHTSLWYSKTNMGLALVQAYNLISKEPEKFKDEIVRIKNLLSASGVPPAYEIFFCNSSEDATGGIELFETELQWARAVWGKGILPFAFIHYDFWNARQHRYRFALPTGPCKAPVEPKQVQHFDGQIDAIQELRDDYPDACKDAKRYGNVSTVVIFRGTSAANYEILKCTSMTPELWVLLVWVVMGSGPCTITAEAYSAYCCLFKPSSGSEAWFDSVFATRFHPVKWEPIEKDMIYDGVVFTRFIVAPD